MGLSNKRFSAPRRATPRRSALLGLLASRIEKLDCCHVQQPVAPRATCSRARTLRGATVIRGRCLVATGASIFRMATCGVSSKFRVVVSAGNGSQESKKSINERASFFCFNFPCLYSDFVNESWRYSFIKALTCKFSSNYMGPLRARDRARVLATGLLHLHFIIVS